MNKNQAKAAIRQAVAGAGLLRKERFTNGTVAGVPLKFLEGDLDGVVDCLFDELVNANVIEVEEPYECWVNMYEQGRNCVYDSESDARENYREHALRVAVHLREVEK